MKFPKEYIKTGNFTLHSGQTSNVFYDVNEMLTNSFFRRKILDNIPEAKHYVGIATAGAIIAGFIASEIGAQFSMIKDGELKGRPPCAKWILIDDVVTTGKSLEQAIQIIGKNPDRILVVLDRREKNENPRVYPVFEK